MSWLTDYTSELKRRDLSELTRQTYLAGVHEFAVGIGVGIMTGRGYRVRFERG